MLPHTRRLPRVIEDNAQSGKARRRRRSSQELRSIHTPASPKQVMLRYHGYLCLGKSMIGHNDRSLSFDCVKVGEPVKVRMPSHSRWPDDFLSSYQSSL